MPAFLNVFCRSARSVSLEELREFVNSGVFFEEPVRLIPGPESPEPADPEWTQVEIHYQQGKRPVILSRFVHPERIHEHREEVLEEIRGSASQAQNVDPIQHLRACQQLFVFEVDPLGATEECWSMVDAIEAWLARQLDGLIFVSEEGLYDATLQLVCGV